MKIEILGKKRDMLLTIGAVKIYCHTTCTSLVDFSASIQKMDVEQAEVCIYAALVGACKAQKETVDFTLDEVKNEIDNWSASRLTELLNVFVGIFNEAKAKNVKAPKKGA